MLTRTEKQDLSDAGTILYGDLEALLMQNIIRHVKGYDQLIDSDTWLIQKLAEIGKLNQENIRIIARSARSNKAVLQKMLDETVDIVMDRIEPGFKELKKEGVIKKAPSPDQSENVKTAVKSIKKQAVSSMNLCSTTMLYKAKDACQKLLMNTFYQAQEIANKQEFLDTLGKHATAQVIGAESRQQAIRNTIREFNEKGIPGFVDKRGREWTPEAYITMTLRTTAGNTATEATFARMEDHGLNLFQVSSHAGARPKCAKDQGKIFDKNNGRGTTTDLRGKEIPYYPLRESSYGEPDGIFGINCGHHPVIFIPGISTRKFFPTDDLKENDELYRKIQTQRSMECEIRKQKRLCMLYEEAGDKEAFEEAAVKLKQKEAQINDYVGKSRQLHRRKDREQMVGFDKRLSAEAVGANKREYTDFVKKVGENNAPSFAKYSQVEYNKSEEYKDLKALAEYRKRVPNASMKHYKLDKFIHENKVVKGSVVPIELHHAYILEDKASKKDPSHIMKRMKERNITDDQVQQNVDNAVICISQYQGTRLLYYSTEGATVLTKTKDYDDVEWIAKTTWSKVDFDENSEIIVREALKYV